MTSPLQNPLTHQLDCDVPTCVLVTTNDVADCWQQLQAANSEQHQVLAIELPAGKNSYNIEQVRELQRLAAFSSGQKRRRELCIVDADKLTIPAQHALLKLLEEPPVATRIWLITQYPQQLLPTIHSRCVMVTMPTSLASPLNADHNSADLAAFEAAYTDNTIVAFLRQPPNTYTDCLLAASSFKDRAAATQACQEAITWLATRHTEVKTGSSYQQLITIAQLQRALLQAIDQLSSNANVKLVLEHCLFVLLPVARRFTA